MTPGETPSAPPSCLATAVPDVPVGTNNGAPSVTVKSSSSLQVNWNADPTGFPENLADTYEIQRSATSQSGPWTTIAANVNPADLLYMDTGLSASTKYWYQLRAVNCFGASAYTTTEISATTSSATPTAAWTLDFSTGEPWSNGTNYTFSSTASTTRTFVNSSGYVAPCVANLIQRSEEFNNAYYTLLDATVTANDTTAPDNTTTADLLKENSASEVHGVYRFNVANSSGTDYTFSVFAKSQNRTAIAIQFMYDSNSRRATQLYDLSGGVVSGSVFYNGTSVTASAAIENFGNGWYRCIFTVNVPAGDFTVFVDLSNSLTPTRLNGHPTYTGNGTDGAYIWGAQLVTGSAALPYSATTSSSSGIPRLTHDRNGSRLGLLVEAQRTNLFLRSAEFNLVSDDNITVTSNQATAPDNTNAGDEIKEDAGTSVVRRVFQGVTVNNSTTYTMSVFAKADTATCIQLVLPQAQFGLNEWATFDVSSGTIGSVGTGVTGSDATITSFGNGWYRCTLTATSTGTVSSNHAIHLTDNQSTTTRAPTYTVTAGNEKRLYLWGWQLEDGSQASSYIPTTTASVTRSADLVHVLDSAITSWGDPGALVVHFYPPLNSGTLISTDDAATAQVGIEASTTTAARAFWSSGSTATGTIGSGVQKAVHYWNGTNSRFCINGGTVQSGTNNLTIANTDFVTLGAEATESGGVPGTFSQYANCVIRKVEFYSGTLTDSQLQAVTT